MEISKKFFKYESEIIRGNKGQIEARLNVINNSQNMSLCFTSNLVHLGADEFALLAQIRTPKGRG